MGLLIMLAGAWQLTCWFLALVEHIEGRLT